MFDATFFDAISWIGLAFCIGAFFIKSVHWLRLSTLLGCSILTFYYMHIEIPQGVVSNAIIVLINLVYLFKPSSPVAEQKVEEDILVDNEQLGCPECS